MQQIQKRNGQVVNFDVSKIYKAIFKSLEASGQPNFDLAKSLGDKVQEKLLNAVVKDQFPKVEEIQDIVEQVLVNKGQAKTAKAFILYRQKRSGIRNQKRQLLNKEDIDDIDKQFDLNSLRVLCSRYLKKDKQGKVIESPRHLFERVATHTALPSIFFDEMLFSKQEGETVHPTQKFDQQEYAGKISIGKYTLNQFHLEAIKRMYDRFNQKRQMKKSFSEVFEMIKNGEFNKYEIEITEYFNLMTTRKFLPNTPALINFGGSLGMGSACFVLPVEDSIESIMQTLTSSAIVFKSGGGMGYNFSKLRPEGDFIKTTGGSSSGPLSFMSLFDKMTDVIKQGGVRRGASMGIMNCFGGETRVNTINGKIPIKKLKDKTVYTYSYDKKNKRLKVAQGFCRQTAKNIEVWKVTLDNDETIIATPDHKFLLSNDRYKQLKHLKVGASIKAFYKIIDNRGYTRIGITGQKNETPEHNLVAEMKIKRPIKTSGKNKRRGNDEMVHHLDRNNLNNNPDNLEVLTISEHSRLHFKDSLQKHQRRIAKKRKGKTLAEVYGKEKAKKWIDKMAKSRKGSVAWNKNINASVYKSHYPKGFKNQFSNHKIKKIEHHGYQDVYDLTVPKFHNFVVEDIFVHNCDHPDIEQFITAKRGNNALKNFNISVFIKSNFWEYYETNKPYPLRNPKNNEVVKYIDPQNFLNLIVYQAWESAEPGVVFEDHVNKHNPFLKTLGPIECTNPCGEIPLFPHGSCNLGSINVWSFCNSKPTNGHKKDVRFDWDEFKRVVKITTKFLDNVIEVNKFPLPEIEEMSLNMRRIGLGMMGVANVLYELELPYNSSEGLKFMEKLMEFLNYHSKVVSVILAKQRGKFPYYDKSFYQTGKLPFRGKEIASGELPLEEKETLDWDLLKEKIKEYGLRNAQTTTNAPTGSISMIAGCSSGIEPNFSLVFEKKVSIGSFYYVNPIFEQAMAREGLLDEELIKQVSDDRGSLQNLNYIPPHLKRVFVTAMDLSAEDHIKALSILQRWTDSAISKTINFPSTATVEDMKKAYLLGHELGCKGLTVFRDQSIQGVLSTGPKDKKPTDQVEKSKIEELVREKDEKAKGPVVYHDVTVDVPPPFKSNGNSDNCPNCTTPLIRAEGCKKCPKCGWGVCTG